MSDYELTNGGHRRRLRERFEKSQDGWRDYELLELLLTFAIPRRDVKPLAKSLLKRYGSLSTLIGTSPDALRREPDVGPAAATLIKVVHSISAAALAEPLLRRDAFRSPRAVANFARTKIAGLPHEAFLLIFVTVQNEIHDWVVMNEGTIDQVAVYPRRIVELALARRAAGVILVHNHPSGYVSPSEDDKRLTRTVKSAADVFDIRVVDHLVVGAGGHFSFVENGLL